MQTYRLPADRALRGDRMQAAAAQQLQELSHPLGQKLHAILLPGRPYDNGSIGIILAMKRANLPRLGLSNRIIGVSSERHLFEAPVRTGRLVATACFTVSAPRNAGANGITERGADKKSYQRQYSKTAVVERESRGGELFQNTK
jgi:hypothetical protein